MPPDKGGARWGCACVLNEAYVCFVGKKGFVDEEPGVDG